MQALTTRTQEHRRSIPTLAQTLCVTCPCSDEISAPEWNLLVRGITGIVPQDLTLTLTLTLCVNCPCSGEISAPEWNFLVRGITGIVPQDATGKYQRPTWLSEVSAAFIHFKRDGHHATA